MPENSWIKEFPGAVTVCDAEGIILEMNAAAEEVFKEDGGRKLIGSNVLDCHPEPARAKFKHMLDTQTANI
ncbi:MAG: PAS domain-containing protein, partial [Anaerolineales bacterium]|nr:PAS domain-containing protein [Anaerolineales bacterium]